jgi:hypothetical protein
VRAHRVFVEIAYLVVFATGCNPFTDSAEPDPMTLQPISSTGVVSVERDAEDFEVTERFALEPGDVVTTSQSGARIQLAGQRRARVASNSSVSILGENSLEHVSGSLLVQARGPSTVLIDRVEAVSDSGLFRLDGDSSSAVAASTYMGSMTLQVPGQDPVEVEPLQVAEVVANGVVNQAPYLPTSDDLWDQGYLRDVIDLQDKLDEFTRLLSAHIDTSTLGMEYFREIMPDKDLSFLANYVGERGRSTSDLLIAFVIAGNDPEESLQSAFRKAFRLREGGAEWATVAGIMEIEGRALLSGLQDAANELIALSGSGLSLTSGSAEGGDQTSPRSQARICINIIDCILQSSGRLP